MATMQRHWDIFCRVIDNFGDIGVCWRLARQLVAEHDLHVRLWVDEPGSLKALHPAIDSTKDQQVLNGVEIRHWGENPTVDRVAEVIIEAFACDLPADYIAAMAATTPKPYWINLEYLTAEAWVDSCHGMASPHPTLPLTKHFFFPGFSSATGGLLRESGLFAARDADLAASAEREALEISLFCYDTAPVAELLDALTTTPNAICCYVPPGKPLAAVRACLGGDGPWQRGNLKILPIPFLPQEEYDRLLWRCDINFVRGEDSFLRAQWAEKPFVWQIYGQAEEAHLIKLEAFLDRYTARLDETARLAVLAMFRAWNTGHGMAAAWPAFFAQRGQLAAQTRKWAEMLSQSVDLASTLVKFCSPKV